MYFYIQHSNQMMQNFFYVIFFHTNIYTRTPWLSPYLPSPLFMLGTVRNGTGSRHLARHPTVKPSRYSPTDKGGTTNAMDGRRGRQCHRGHFYKFHKLLRSNVSTTRTQTGSVTCFWIFPYTSYDYLKTVVQLPVPGQSFRATSSTEETTHVQYLVLSFSHVGTVYKNYS